MNDDLRRHRHPPGGADHDLRLLVPEPVTHVGAVLGSAGITHAVLLLALFVLLVWRPPLPVSVTDVSRLAERTEVVFLPDPAAPGGGGGGGDRSTLPPRTSVVPAVRPVPALVPEAAPEPTEPDPIVMDVPEVPNRAPMAMVGDGVVPGVTFGAGRSPGAGRGDQGGIGGGGPRGVGRGAVPGIGDGRGCTGRATDPVPLNQPRPTYTSAAMQRGFRGEAVVSCIVTATGETAGCTIVRPLDGNAFGLDDQALKAAGEFRFRPGMCRDQPVPVRVNIILEFNLQ